jgi:ABC-2 type transport system permease protein
MSSRTRAEGLRWLNKANSVQHWLPPGLAALDLQRSAAARPLAAMEAASLLGIYVLGVGGVLGMRLRGEYHGENFGDAPARRRAERRTRSWLLDGSGPMAAVLEKEARVLTRAMPLIYALAAPLLMVFLLSGLFANRGGGQGSISSFSLMVALAYALVGFTQLFYNNLGPEGPGIQLLFLSPTPMRTVMMAKNLFHMLLFSVDAVLVCFLASLRIGGWPAPAAIAATFAWLLFALPVHLAAGNLFSLNMPYRMNLGRITRQRGSQVSALLSMLIQLGVLGIGVGILVVCAYFHRLWLAVPVFLVLAAGAFIAWMRVLNSIDGIAARRRETLLATLVRTD